MIACRYSHFSFSFPSENENLKKYFLLNILIKVQKIRKLMSREWMVFLNEGVILEAYQIVGNNRRING